MPFPKHTLCLRKQQLLGARVLPIAGYAALAAILLTLPAAAQSDKTPPGNDKVMLVLDASGSMRGHVGGKRKIDIARGVIRDILKTWDRKIDLGLIAYGHRRKGDCRDIQTIYRLGSANSARVMQSVNRLRPIGKTPLGAAVLHAARALKYTEDRATVILVSDGRENCGIDPCKLGRRLEKNGVDFTVHVVGFDIKRGEERGLQCLARNTGGKYYPAADAEALARAMKKTVREVKRARPKPAPKPKKVETAFKAGQGGLRLRATYKKDGAPITSKKLRWVVHRIVTVKGELGAPKKSKLVWLGSGANRRGPVPHWLLKAGTYQITVDLGNASARGRFNVRAGVAAEGVINLNAGALGLSATYRKGADPITSNKLGWVVHRIVAEKGELGAPKKTKLVWLGSGANRRGPKANWLLNAGEYQITIKLGNASAKERFSVKAAGETGGVVNLNAGALGLSATYRKGADPITSKKLGWVVHRIVTEKGELGAPKKTKLVWLGSGANRRGPKANWLLNAGEYQITIKLGNASARGRFSVKAAGETGGVVNLNAGSLKLTAATAKSGQPIKSQNVRWVVHRIVTEKGELGAPKKTKLVWLGSGANRRGPKANWLLNTGDYQITVNLGNAKTTIRVTVKPSETTEETAKLPI